MKKINLFILVILFNTIIIAQPFNNFLGFDGVSDYAKHNFSGTNIPSGDFTFEFWIYSCDAAGYKLIDAAGSTAGTGLEMSYSHNGGGIITTTMRASSSSPTTNISSSAMGTNAWHHFALTYTSSNKLATIYVDGQLDDTITVAAFGPSARFWIGRQDYTPAGFLKVSLDELRISSTIRYTSSFTPQTTEFVNDVNTKALYHFNGTNTNLTDASSNGYHLIAMTPGAVPISAVPTTQAVVTSITTTQTSICNGDSTVLKLSSGSVLNDNKKWKWYSSSCGGSLLGEGDSVVVSPTVTTNYFVRGEEGCATTSSCQQITITVNSLPTVSITAFNPNSVCSNSTAITLPTATPSGGTYTGTGVSGGNFNPSTAGVGTHYVTYTFTDGNSCSNTDSTAVTVNSLPTVSITAFNPNSVCSNSTAITLPTATPSGGTYTGTGVSGGNFNPSTAGVGTHYVTYTFTDGNSCSNTDSTAVTVNSLPTVSITAFNPNSVCSNSTAITLPTATPSGGTYTGTGVSGGNFNPSTARVGTHYVTYTFTDGNSCSNIDSTVITVNICTGIESNTNNQLKIAPNPFNNQLSITGLEGSNLLRLIDVQGKLVFEEQTQESNVLIPSQGLKQGVYFLQIVSNNNIITKKVIKQ